MNTFSLEKVQYSLIYRATGRRQAITNEHLLANANDYYTVFSRAVRLHIHSCCERKPWLRGMLEPRCTWYKFLSSFQFRDNRPGILSWPRSIRAQKGWLILTALCIPIRCSYMHRFSLKCISILPQHTLLKRSYTSTLCPALVVLSCRQLSRKTLFQGTELPLEMHPRWWGASAEPAWLPATSIRSEKPGQETLRHWYCQAFKLEAKIERKRRP